MLNLKPKPRSGYNGQTVTEIYHELIFPNPAQPRKVFDFDELAGLAGSIAANGIIQPLLVRELDSGNYELISGERRLRAARIAGLKTVPCIISSVDSNDSAVFALIENLQRQNLNFFEEAEAIRRLCLYHNMTQQEVGKRLGKSQSCLSNKLRLLKINEEQRKLIIENGLTERHARVLLKITNQNDFGKILSTVIEKKLNVEQTEKLVESYTLPSPEKPQSKIKICADVRLFINTINHALDVMKKSGIEATSKKNETDDYIEYTVIIPKTGKRPA